mmetsp:Transcript_58335/g.103671  ORF Transcript_58335/g.103671 Transcript_58335/m.103671 type:complete len:102 (-) Transcript_58335:554-859(-)
MGPSIDPQAVNAPEAIAYENAMAKNTGCLARATRPSSFVVRVTCADADGGNGGWDGMQQAPMKSKAAMAHWPNMYSLNRSSMLASCLTIHGPSTNIIALPP